MLVAVFYVCSMMRLLVHNYKASKNIHKSSKKTQGILFLFCCRSRNQWSYFLTFIRRECILLDMYINKLCGGRIPSFWPVFLVVFTFEKVCTVFWVYRSYSIVRLLLVCNVWYVNGLFFKEIIDLLLEEFDVACFHLFAIPCEKNVTMSLGYHVWLTPLT